MELTCSPDKDTVLTLPKLGTTKVQFINYKEGYVTIELGNSWPSCLLPNQTVLNLMSLTYRAMFSTVSLITCPSMFVLNARDPIAGPVLCLSSAGKYVYVVSTDAPVDVIPSSCMVLQSNIQILQRSEDDAKSDSSVTWETNVNDFLVRRLMSLTWLVTVELNRCLECEIRGRQCGYDLARNETFCKPHGNNLNLNLLIFLLINENVYYFHCIMMRFLQI
jgi:hypothetical protein